MPRVSLPCLVLAISILGGASAARAADPVSGAAVFKSQCSLCHFIEKGNNMIGPSLSGVVGRASGSVDGFHYSAPMAAANLTWDEATLNRYITAPRTVVPGTTMGYGGLKDDKRRADLIAYLGTLH
jgi:cytochrome c